MSCQDILNYVIVENQTANEFYKNWTKEEMENEDAFKLITEYKKSFIEVVDLEPIKELSFEDSKIALRG